MLLEVLKKRFEDTQFDGWQGYGFIGFPKPARIPVSTASTRWRRPPTTCQTNCAYSRSVS